MRIAIYSRKSIYTSKGESIENQVEMCRKYIMSHIDDAEKSKILVYEDEGFSGKNMDRPQLQKMLKDSRVDQFDYIVCYRLDRISRSVGDFATLIQDLSARKISFICIREQFNTSTSMGRAMMFVASVFAQLERETIAERVRDNMLLLARTGRWLGGTTPTGYISKKTEECIFDGKIKTLSSLEENPTELLIVKIIFSKYLKLRSLRALERYLSDKELFGRTNERFSIQGLKDILRNPVYCTADKTALNYFLGKESDVCFGEEECIGERGLLAYNKRDTSNDAERRNDESKWIIALGRHKGAISGDEWVQVQKILLQNSFGKNNYAKSSNNYALLSGKICCGICGAKMIAKRRGNNVKLFDYICENKLKYGVNVCDCKNINGSCLDQRICDYMFEYCEKYIDFTPCTITLKNKLEKQSMLQPMGMLEAEIDRIRRETEILVKTICKAGGNLKFISAIEKRIGELENRLEHLTKIKKNKVREEISNTEEITNLCEVLSGIKTGFTFLTIHEKRDFVQLILANTIWDGKDIHIYIRNILQE